MSTERDLAHEADMRELMREQLRNDISVEEANEEAEALQEYLGDFDEHDDDDLGFEELRRSDETYNNAVSALMKLGLAHFIPSVHASYWGAR